MLFYFKTLNFGPIAILAQCIAKKIPVIQNDTLGYEKKIQKKIKKNYFFFLNPEFWSHHAKIPVKKSDTLGCRKK